MKNQNNQNQDNQSVIMEAVKRLKFESKYQKDKDCDRIELKMSFDDMCEVANIRTGLVDILGLVGQLTINYGIQTDEVNKLANGINAIATVLEKSSDYWVSTPLTDIIKTPIE